MQRASLSVTMLTSSTSAHNGLADFTSEAKMTAIGEVDMMIWASSDVKWIEIHSIWLLSFTAAFNVSKTEKQKTIALSYVEFVTCLRLDLMHLLKVQTKYMWVSLTFFVGKHPNPPHPPLNDKSPRVCSVSLSKSSVGLLSSKKEWTAFNKNILFIV